MKTEVSVDVAPRIRPCDNDNHMPIDIHVREPSKCIEGVPLIALSTPLKRLLMEGKSAPTTVFTPHKVSECYTDEEG